MATLRNRSRRTQSYNLPHDPYCSDGTCRCVPLVQQSLIQDGLTGKVGVVEQPFKGAASVSFSAGQTLEGLPDTIVKCPDIIAAIGRGELVEVKPEPSRQETKPVKRGAQPPAEA